MKTRWGWNLAVLLVLTLGLLPAATLAAPGSNPGWCKVESSVARQLEAEGKAGFFIILTAQADLSGAASLTTKLEKTRYVFEHLKKVADETQWPVRDYLRARGVAHQAYYIQNAIRVEEAGRDVVAGLAARPDVAQIAPLPRPELDPVIKALTPEQRISAIEWNVQRVNAPQVWALGYRGEGLVVASNDTGVDYTHPALVGKYRGNLGGGNFDHNYNWWNGPGSPVPVDQDGHGTHTTGTMVGDDGAGNQIGVAPGAKWIACGGLQSSDPVECFQFFLAPWDLNQQNPDPARAPDAINNSWYDPSGFDYRPIIQTLNSAGIVVVKSAGNQGPGCSTITNPGYVPEVIATGAFAQGDVIASFSSRGPSSQYGEPIVKPEVAAPGVNIRSSVPGGGYEGGWQGTSMAAPHTTALVALMWSAAPCILGDVVTTKQIMMQTAQPKIDPQCPPFVDHPNDVWGWGILDDLAAVQYAIGLCGGLGTLEGTVTDATTALPIEEVEVTALGSGGFARTAITDETGFYTMELISDTYTVSASVYGYEPSSVPGVVIEPDATTVVDLALTPLPVYTVSGYVTDAVSNAPLGGTVRFTDAPVPPVSTDPNTGFYSIQVAQGTWHLKASAARHMPQTVELYVDGDLTQDFALQPLPPILLVDDDANNPDVRSYWTGALDALGLEYAVWDVYSQGNPTSSDLTGYRMVFWFTGYPWGSSFVSDNESAVAGYLDAGGCFWLSSEEYLYDMGLTAFGQQYLHIGTYSSDENAIDPVGNAGDPLGDGLGPYLLVKPSGWTGTLWTDYADDDGAPGASSPFRWQASGQNAGTDYDGGTFKTVFFPWPFEGLANLADRTAVMGRIVDWCTPPPLWTFIPLVVK